MDFKHCYFKHDQFFATIFPTFQELLNSKNFTLHLALRSEVSLPTFFHSYSSV